MRKFFLRWLDSWSPTSQAEENLPRAGFKDSKIRWMRILPFILLHIACLSVFWVGVSWFAVIFMLLFYVLRMFSITAFFTVICRIRLSKLHVRYSLFLS